MPFAPEPAAPRTPAPLTTAVLLCNLGTPDAPTAPAVRRYLAEFLSDPRVIEIPKFAWWPILHGIVLRVRPAKSAAKYQTVWTPEGSPLKVWTVKQARLLEGYLGERGHRVLVRPAMRYGHPSIAGELDALKAAGVQRILILPMYPQYCAATTASVNDAVYQWAQRVRSLPELRFVNRYHADAGYIDALARRLGAHWQDHGRPDRLVLSFHGMPQRTQKLGDPYQQECLETAQQLAQRLGLKDAELAVTFQSRFGKAAWLQPYTEPALVELARQGAKRVDVMCPGFTADCLETLEEIAQEAKTAFLEAGGQEFHHVPCLNDQHEWIAALSAIALRHLQGWDTQVTAATTTEARRTRTLERGGVA